MRLRRFYLVMLLATLASFYSQGQNKGQNYYSSAGFYHNLSGGDFQEMQAVSFTYRFSSSSSWGGTLSVGYTGFPKMENNQKLFFSSLLCSILPVEMERFRIIPSIGLGVANGKGGGGNFTKLFFDTSVDAQYSVSENMYCGGEYRYMTNGEKSFSFHLMGLKIGFSF